jgi:hypothetical protein
MPQGQTRGRLANAHTVQSPRAKLPRTPRLGRHECHCVATKPSIGALGAAPTLGVGVGVGEGLELLPLLHPPITSTTRSSSQKGR